MGRREREYMGARERDRMGVEGRSLEGYEGRSGEWVSDWGFGKGEVGNEVRVRGWVGEGSGDRNRKGIAGEMYMGRDSICARGVVSMYS